MGERENRRVRETHEPLPSRVSFSRTHFFLYPLLPSTCYAGYATKGIVFLPFRSEKGYRLCSLWSGIWYGFRVYEPIYGFNSKWIRKKGKYVNLKWILRNLFCWHFNLSNDDIISLRPGLKTGVKNDIFCSEIGSGFGELGSALLPRIPRVTHLLF